MVKGVCKFGAWLGRRRIAAVLFAGALSVWLSADAPSIAASAAASTYARVSHCSAHFIVDACRDNGGNIWLATEDHGIFCFDPHPGTDQTAQYWQHFTASDGLADATAQSVACDSKGRIWVGSLCHGVTVYSGQSWQRYGLLTDAAENELAGPIGEHIFSIRISPLDGSVWLCTNSGIARYESGYKTVAGKKLAGQWQYYTVAEGLPADDVQTVAFGPNGRVYAATRCDGIAIARPIQKDRIALRRHKLLGPLQYKAWRIVKSRFENQVPLTPTGTGLPSNLLNDILVTPNGTAWAATDAGIAMSTDGGYGWRFLRGNDWLAKDQGLVHPPSKLFVLDAAKQVSKTRILSEDYCTCLAQDAQGNIWVGHRQTGIDIINPTKNEIIPLKLAATSPDGKPWQQPHKYVDKILMLPSSPPIIFCYGGGAFELPKWLAGKANAVQQRDAGADTKQDSVATTGKPAAMPAAAGVPTQAQLAFEEQKVSALAKKLWRGKTGPRVIKLDSDWRTEGNWLGRYGTYRAVLCAMNSPSDLYSGAGWRRFLCAAKIGPHRHFGDVLRHWVQWLYTSDPRVLELPKNYLDMQYMRGLAPSAQQGRREAEWDDHGEAYPMTWQGPGIYASVHVPPGLFFLAFYNVNKDGHTGTNRWRDYTVDVRQAPGGAAQMESLPLAQFNSWPEFARQRIVGFWSGVYTRFMVHGPITLCIKLGRNYSFNTILSAVMVSLAEEKPPPYFSQAPAAAEAPFLIRSKADRPPRSPQMSSSHAPLGPSVKPPFLPVPIEIIRRWKAGVALTAARLRAAQSSAGGATRDRTSASAVPRLEWTLHRFRRSEVLLRRLGFVTARDIEESLRWNGTSKMPSTLGCVAVENYVRRHGVLIRDAAAEQNLEKEK